MLAKSVAYTAASLSDVCVCVGGGASVAYAVAPWSGIGKFCCPHSCPLSDVAKRFAYTIANLSVVGNFVAYAAAPSPDVVLPAQLPSAR